MTVAPINAAPKYTERDLLSFILARSGAHQQAVAVWRLPGSRLTQVLISDKHIELDREGFLEELDPGFLFAPFDRSRKRIFLKADRLLTFEDGEVRPQSTPGDDQGAYQWLSEELKAFTREKYTPGESISPPPADGDMNAFTSTVAHALAEITSGSFQKVVPSRTKTVELPDGFEVVEAFQKLYRAYPNALVSYVSIPGIGNWIGATPELLVSVQDKTTFRTVALAGTQPYHPGTDIRSVAWTQKEIEEQALVERYVISCFKKVRLREYDEHGPRTVVAGNLMHLKSEFTVDIGATNFPQIGTVMLDLLHPTSAVCGMPLDAALGFLGEHESHDREFYAGYLGPVNIHNDVELFVNIRCMKVSSTHGTLYAGAGITVDSVAEREWAETEMKFQTLLNVLF